MYKLPAESTATPGGAFNRGAGGRAAVTAVNCRPVSRHGGDRSVRNLADPVVIRIGDVQVAGGAHRDSCWDSSTGRWWPDRCRR